jgi:hypothetical protein
MIRFKKLFLETIEKTARHWIIQSIKEDICVKVASMLFRKTLLYLSFEFPLLLKSETNMIFSLRKSIDLFCI